MSQISDRILAMSESATLAMTQKSRELQAQGLDIINLSIGEPDFNTPDHIKAAAIKAIENNQTHYPPVPGYPDLRKAIVARMKNWLGLDYDVNQVIVSAGGKHSLVNIILAVYLPRPSVAKLKMLAHMTDVQRPQRTRNKALMGTCAISKLEPLNIGMLVIVSRGENTAQAMRMMATDEVNVISVLLDTLPAMKEEMVRPTSISNQYIPATKPAMAAEFPGAFPFQGPLPPLSAR